MRLYLRYLHTGRAIAYGTRLSTSIRPRSQFPSGRPLGSARPTDRLRRLEHDHCCEGATLMKDYRIQTATPSYFFLPARWPPRTCLPMRVARAATPAVTPGLASRLAQPLTRRRSSLFRSILISCRRVGPLAVPPPAGAPFSGNRAARDKHAKLDARVYDSTGPWGWLGRNLRDNGGEPASHFGTWVGHAVASYAAGTLKQYSACIYIGSTYGRAVTGGIPNGRLRRNVPTLFWIYDNIWQLNLEPARNLRSGMALCHRSSMFLRAVYGDLQVQSLKRYSANASGT